MRTRFVWIGIVMSALTGGCAEDQGATCEPLAEGERKVLVDHALWRLATPEEDPWRAFRPDDVTCPQNARQPEDFAGTPSFGIDTTNCGYTTVVQETLVDACRGDNAFVWMWRYALTGPEGAEAHIAITIGDEPLFEDVVPIPTSSDLKVKGYALAEDHPAGTKVFFHVRNHGSNTYQLLELARCKGECVPTAP
ncbi:MAG: hypothetical protein JNJ59_26595 [Deltaproteobacteria bacterium]|nr:hypothetical protein [Deltaproteobacteria bacterium]